MAAFAMLAVGASSASSSPSARVVFASDRDSWQLFTIGVDGGPARQLTSGLDNKTEPAWSPDGRSIAYVGDREGEPKVYLASSDGGRERRLAGGNGHEGGPTWSPDSRFVAFSRDGSLFVAAADGTGERQLTTGPQDSVPAWSPRGDRIAFLHGCSPYVVGTDGTGARPIGTDPPCAGRLSWSPDGTKLTALLVYPVYGPAGVYVIDAATGTSVRIAGRNRLDYGEPTWAPDGRTIAFSSGCEFCAPSVLKLLDVDGTGERVLTAARRHYEETIRVGDYSPSWSPDGRSIVFSRNTAGTSQIYSMLSDGTGLARVSHGPYTELMPAADPTGRLIAFYRRSARGTLLVPLVMNADGRNVRALKRPRGLVPFGTLDWSPGGRRLALGSYGGLWTWDRATGRFRRVTTSSAVDPFWSSDARRIGFTQPTAENGFYPDGTLASIGADGTGFRVLSRRGCPDGEGDWSADGTTIVFERLGSLYSMPTARGAERLIVPSGSVVYPVPAECQPPAATRGAVDLADPEWSQDGRTIAAHSNLEQVSPQAPGVYLFDTDGRRLRRIADGAWPTWVRGG